MFRLLLNQIGTVDAEIDVGQEINIGPENFGKNDKPRTLNNSRA